MLFLFPVKYGKLSTGVNAQRLLSPVLHHPSVPATLPCRLSIAGVLDIIGHRWQLQASRHDVTIHAVTLAAKSSACSDELTAERNRFVDFHVIAKK